MDNLCGKKEHCRILAGGRRIDLYGDEHGNLTVMEGHQILWQQTVWVDVKSEVK